MGFAKAAELNGNPGAAHVLELADELGLTPGQRAEAQALKDSMKNAATLGARLVDAEPQLDTLFARGEAGTKKLLAWQNRSASCKRRYVWFTSVLTSKSATFLRRTK